MITAINIKDKENVMEKELKKDVILINKMCTGSYTINNIGYEIINYFKANDDNVYIYILPDGSISKGYDNRIKTILLTSSLSNHKIEIIAKIEEPKQEIFSDMKKNKEQKEVHKEQVEKYKNVLYGGKTLEDIFKYNYKNDEAIHITFKTNAKNMKKPKDKMRIFITDDVEYKNSENCKYIHIKSNIASSSLKQYFKEGDEDYDAIEKYLDDKYWENYNPEEITEESIKNDEKINFLQLIEKEDEEQIYTNMLCYWFSRKNIFNEFLKYIDLNEFIDIYELEKEKVIPGGRTDILALGEKNIIVIENKILSGINGIETGKIKENYNIPERTQLSKYITGIKKRQEEGKLLNKDDKRTIKGLIFIPDYRDTLFNNEIYKLKENKIIDEYYKIIKYSKLYEFFCQKEIKEQMLNDLYGKKYYNDFLNGMEFQMQSNISDKNKIEMKRKFIYAIKHADRMQGNI